ncbi:putative chemoreceptor glutamine deamidase CheD [Planctomycetota bacterium]|nr:putative chemoreceptor glutamine deamidase CheD [Planctomycetota bacterium]
MSCMVRTIKEIKVLIGQVHLTRPPHLLQSVLGSCIGLVIYDLETRLTGMAHVLLPHSDGKPRGVLPGKYGDHAVACIIEGLLTHGAARSRLRAKMAGGARMFGHALDYQRDIGSGNIASVESSLKQAGIPVVAQHVGGTLGRRIEFDPESLNLVVEDFGERSLII